jgi:transposase
MNIDLSMAKVYIRPGITDLRKAVNGLGGIIEQDMKGEPFSGNVYIFCNRDRKLIKAVYWERNGFWLCQKRLEKDKFPWPLTNEAVKELSTEELAMLLQGIDFFRAHKALYYKNIS